MSRSEHRLEQVYHAYEDNVRIRLDGKYQYGKKSLFLHERNMLSDQTHSNDHLSE